MTMSIYNRVLKKSFVILFLIIQFVLNISSAISAENKLVVHDCTDQIVQKKYGVLRDAWNTSPLANKYLSAIKEIIIGENVINWTYHNNRDGSKTIIVDAKYPHDDQDNFILIIENSNVIKFRKSIFATHMWIADDAASINGLYFCTKNGISNKWVWGGSNWEVGSVR